MSKYQSKARSRTRLLIGTVVVLLSISALFFVLANLLFSQTYDMLSLATRSRVESQAEQLAGEMLFMVVVDAREDAQNMVDDFRRRFPEIKAISVWDAHGRPFVKSGEVPKKMEIDSSGVAGQTVSVIREGMITASAPCREGIDEPVVGYVVLRESIRPYLGYRRQVMIIAVLCSVLGLAIVGRLIYSQISISLENQRLLNHLETQAQNLADTNRDLESEIDERKKAQAELTQYRDQLEVLVEERTEALAKTQQELMAASRQAGMAEVATGVLHDVGNVLNSVNISAQLVQEEIKHSEAKGLSLAVELMNRNEESLGQFIEEDPKGKMLPKYLEELAMKLEQEHQSKTQRIEKLIGSVNQMRTIILAQQSYARLGGVREFIRVEDLIKEAIQINEASLARHKILVNRKIDTMPKILADRQKLTQILVNLINNARDAVRPDSQSHKITIRAELVDGFAEIGVEDNGVGIPPENLTRIFNHGFTTRKEGHGFGLHSSANAAKEMGGNLVVHSDGPGKGAAFVLKLPIEEEGENHGLSKRVG